VAKNSVTFKWDRQEDVGLLGKNKRGDYIVVAICSTGEKTFVDVRNYYTSEEGKILPTSKGIAIPYDRVGGVLELLEKALEQIESEQEEDSIV